MGDDKLVELYRQHRTFQDKYTYFILAAAASGIALVVNNTQDEVISLTMIPLAAAVICWGFSFYYGCRHLNYVSSNLYANIDLLKVERGIHPDVGQHPEKMIAASQGIRQAFENNSDKASKLAINQFNLLISGAIFYLIWHTIEMVVRTIK